MAEEQTLAVGTTVSSKYGKLGGFTGRMIVKPSKIVALLVSLPGAGKSSLLQSCPDMFVFNFDKTSTPLKTPLATVWPGVNAQTGMCIGNDGQPLILTWEVVLGQINILAELAEKKEPRPETVSLDSITTWIPLLQEYLVRNAKALGLRKEGASHWKDLDGQAAWDVLYTAIISTISRLQNHGYGVYLTAHISKDDKRLAKGATSPYAIAMGAGLWNRLIPIVELAAFLIKSPGTRQVLKKTAYPSSDGKTTYIEKMEDENCENVYLKVSRYTQQYDVEGVTKARVRFDPILIPEQGGWEAFVAAYNAATAKA